MANHSKDLWINPRSNIKGPDGNRAWDNTGNISPNSGERFLELADIALGLKEPAPRKKKTAHPAASAHSTAATKNGRSLRPSHDK